VPIVSAALQNRYVYDSDSEGRNYGTEIKKYLSASCITFFLKSRAQEQLQFRGCNAKVKSSTPQVMVL